MGQHRADARRQRKELDRTDAPGCGDARQRDDEQREGDTDDPPAIDQVGERNDEKEPEGIPRLRIECDAVGLEGRRMQLRAEQLEQRLVIIKVRHRQPRDHGQRTQQPLRNAGTGLQHRPRHRPERLRACTLGRLRTDQPKLPSASPSAK